nr:histone deacetylase family protein [Acidimicrobiia bacterium]
GEGCNRNAVVAPGGGDEPWLAALDGLLDDVGMFGADALVVSLGVDAAADDPESPLLITAAGYGAAGERLGALGLPTVAVQEGGYHLPTLGPLVLATLAGIERGLATA